MVYKPSRMVGEGGSPGSKRGVPHLQGSRPSNLSAQVAFKAPFSVSWASQGGPGGTRYKGYFQQEKFASPCGGSDDLFLSQPSRVDAR